MKRPPPRNAKLQERIVALQRELARVEGTIEELDSAVRSPDRESAAARLRGLTEPPREPAPPRSPARPSPVVAPPVAPPPAAVGSVESLTTEELEASLPKMTGDRRFASYFVTGSLQSVRPLRTERRMQRNRAIIMTIIAIFLLFGVITLVHRSLSF